MEQDCTTEQIRDAYYKLAKKYHPDLNPDEEDKEETFKMITLAYETLSNKQNRSLYDSYMDIDPNMNVWEMGEEMHTDYQKDKAKYDEYSQDQYQNKGISNFWEGNFEKDEFQNKFYKDFERIFRAEFNQSGSVKGNNINSL